MLPVGGGGCVLVVDDEPLIRWSLRERLEQEGFRVLSGANGREALALGADADLVLLDYRLPDTDGLSVARDLKAARERRPVILMTAYGSPELEQRASDIRVEGVVQKPFDLERLARLVRDALRRAARD